MDVGGTNIPFLILSIVVSVLVLLAIIFGITFAVVGSMAKKNRTSAEQEYPNARHVETSVNFFGQESKGVMQARGNGTMILTDDAIVFKQWVVNKEFRIPYNTITAIETPRSHLGKTQGVELLKVVYTNEQGAPDSIAWRVRDLGELKRLIEDARSG